jgi:cell division protein ZipA
MAELRWILVAASVVLLVWIYWRGRSRGLASVEPPQLHEASIVRERPDPPIVATPRVELNPDDLPEVRVAGAGSGTLDAALNTAALEKLTLTQPLRVEPRLAATPARPLTPRKVVALRVASERPMPGERLAEWFAAQNLRHGKYDIFHRYDEHGDLQFSVASMVEPGSFDLQTLTTTLYPGVSLFLQLPSAADGVAAFDEMLACAFALQKEFGGDIFGERNAPLTGDLAEHMRKSIANFQQLVPQDT